MLNVLVADDEPLARDSVEVLLKNHKKVSNIFTASNALEAINISKQELVHIAFLDIQMPETSGIELANLLPPECNVVFVSAHDSFAIPAFELDAVDYVLKPFGNKRFNIAVERAIERTEQPNQQASDRLAYRERLVIRDRGRIRLIDIAKVNYITGAGNYAELHLNDGKVILHRETMSALEQQLSPQEFVRIHRSSIVRRAFVNELRPNEKGDYLVILESGETLTLSRRKRDKLDALIG